MSGEALKLEEKKDWECGPKKYCCCAEEEQGQATCDPCEECCEDKNEYTKGGTKKAGETDCPKKCQPICDAMKAKAGRVSLASHVARALRIAPPRAGD